MPGRKERAVHAGTDGDIQIGVVQNHHRVLAAHFHLDLLARFHALYADPATRGDRSGKADGVDAGMFHHTRADAAAAPHDKVEDPVRTARILEDAGDFPGAAGCQVCRFQDHAIAVGQCRCGLPDRDRDGKVPRCDQADNP